MKESRYITGRELAELCGVSYQYFRKSVYHAQNADFIANVQEVGSPRKKMYLRADALAWIDSRGKERMQKFTKQLPAMAKIAMGKSSH